uniref:DUF4224 domain-containing protein n=1 Tax=Candidatus Kentrum sp. LFY TaxID=2126342 RepID=A0A450WC04_9GAMM|nr:MAG: protein of unknown function (DUF4224) [Candidatus Kentron sp. LFY]
MARGLYKDKKISMTSGFLNESELRRLTGKVRYTAQIRALRWMGIEHRIRPDGRPIVLRSQVDMTYEPYNRFSNRAWNPDLGAWR